jgi:MFS family permease
LRSVQNIGAGAGAALAALALQADTQGAYQVVVAVNAATFVLSALLLLRVGQPAAAGPAATAQSRVDRRRVFRDLPYLSLAGLNAVLMFQFGVITTGIPLWIVNATPAPRWVISAAVVLNTVMVIVLQVPLSRRVTDTAAAARAFAWSGLLLGGAAVVLGSAGSDRVVVATALVLAGTVLLTLGEVLCAAGGWGLSYDLAPPDAHGAYQGVFTTGAALGMLLSPVVVVHTGIQFGLRGWLLLGVLFAVAGLLAPPAHRWALARSTRTRAAVPIEDDGTPAHAGTV